MDWFEIVAGLLFITWPLTYHRSMGKARDRVAARGHDPARLDAAMDRPFFRIALWLVPVIGLVLLIAGVT